MEKLTSFYLCALVPACLLFVLGALAAAWREYRHSEDRGAATRQCVE